MTDAELREIAEKATPGPWVASGVTHKFGEDRFMFVNYERLGEICRLQLPDRPAKGYAPTICDQRFIAAFNPATALALLDRLELAENILTPAEYDVCRERTRQVIEEGWPAEHDDKYRHGELARAASCYAYEAGRSDHQREVDAGYQPPMWPWSPAWWKPTGRRRDLVKAAALIIAEIERLDRAALTKDTSNDE